MVAFLAVSGAWAAPPEKPQSPMAFTILHTSDVHAHLMAFDCASGTAMGGYARLKAYCDRLKAEGRNVCVLSTGDVFQGTLFFRFFRGIPDVSFMDETGFRAMNIGNHEFDAGQDGMLEAFRQARFPLLAANLRFVSKPQLAELVKPWTIVPLETPSGTIRLGLLGVTDEALLEDVPKAFLHGIEIEDAQKAIDRELPRLEAAGADLVVLMSHCGWNRDVALLEANPRLSGALGGHTHRFADPPAISAGPGGHRFLSHSGENGIAVSRLDLRFTPGSRDGTRPGRLEVAAAGLIPLSGTLPEDAGIKVKVDALWEQVREKVDVMIASTVSRLEGEKSQVRRRETNLGNLVADCFREALPADIAFINGGGIRASILGPGVTIGDALNVQPFDNYLTRLTMRGSSLEKLFLQVREGILTQPGFGGFLQVSSGFAVFYGKNGNRLELDGRGIVPEKLYTVTTNDFLANGGNGLSAFTEAVASEPCDILGADAFIRGCKARGTIDARVENRIVSEIQPAGIREFARRIRVPRPH